MEFSKILFLLTFCLIFVNPVNSQPTSQKILGNFEEGWQRYWVERKITRKATKYEVVAEDSNLVLKAESDNSASGLWRMLEIRPGRRGKISWRWKVSHNLSKKTPEKTKLGDDYAARLFVVFEPHFLSWKTRALCYVWAAQEPVGSTYRSPYAQSVGMVVVRSGGKNKGKWMKEERNIISDYEQTFGKAPEMITAVAIMADTDNTGQMATAYFDDIILSVSTPEGEATQTVRSKTKFDF